MARARKAEKRQLVGPQHELAALNARVADKYSASASEAAARQTAMPATYGRIDQREKRAVSWPCRLPYCCLYTGSYCMSSATNVAECIKLDSFEI
eukprot:6212787-Pleurochrysis_carterae.AAC.2